jgi:hypothetical protein
MPKQSILIDVPNGFRAVSYGTPKTGQLFLAGAIVRTAGFDYTLNHYPLLEAIKIPDGWHQIDLRPPRTGDVFFDPNTGAALEAKYNYEETYPILARQWRAAVVSDLNRSNRPKCRVVNTACRGGDLYDHKTRELVDIMADGTVITYRAEWSVASAWEPDKYVVQVQA